MSWRSIMDKKITCFVTYCQKDVSVCQMNIIIDWMKELCNDKIQFLFDKRVKFSESFKDFEAKIFSADAIIIFFTPEYRKRCLDEIDTGVSREYRKILKVHEESQKVMKEELRSFFKERKIIDVILFKGNKESSITYEFCNEHYLDMSSCSKFCEDKKGNLILTNNFKNNYSKRMKEMLDEIITVQIEKDDTYNYEYEKILKELFIDTKGEHVKLPEELFIETKAYNDIIKQQKYLIIGRKGSGKTTVKTTVSTDTRKRYKGIISIIADQFSIEETYELLYKNNKIKSDIETNFSKIDSYKILWYAFINIYCIFIVYKEHLMNTLTHDEQKKHISSLERLVVNIVKDQNRVIKMKDEEITKTIYFYVLSNLERYIDMLIEKSRNHLQYMHTDIKSFYTPDNYLKFLIGNVAFKDFFCIIQFCNKRIFITLDGFDVKFELFKEITNQIEDNCERKRRFEFENIWLMIFIETLIELKSNSKLSGIIDLCLAMPVDRIESIKENNRDFYKYHAYSVALSWNSSDLLQLIIHRLKYLNKLDEERYNELDEIMKKIYPSIPPSIQMDRNGYSDMPLFLYILRKSFWRPRDIIRYYGCILTMKKTQKTLSGISIKRTLKDESFRIIQDEFFGEFKNLYRNLKEIVNLFNAKNQIISYKEMYEIIENQDFIIDGNIVEREFEKKIKILYVIGFLGINLPADCVESQYLFDEYAFVFTEGTSLLRILKSDLRYECKFIIHPIFTEYLFLKVDYNKLVCNYTWNYVNNIDCSNIDYVMYED